MAYEWRKGRLYYYRKQRINGKVVSTYYGPAGGEYARLWSSLVAIDRERREQERMERTIARNEFAELASTAPELVELLAEAKRVTAEALHAAGYHQHDRGEWRKKRGHNKDENQTKG
jgi:hypothetical protein